jgi:hypothetical protein
LIFISIYLRFLINFIGVEFTSYPLHNPLRTRSLTMKTRLILALTLSVLAANTFAADGFERTRSASFAENGSDRTGSAAFAEDGASRTQSATFAEDGSDRTHSATFAEDGSDRTQSATFAADGSDRTGARNLG